MIRANGLRTTADIAFPRQRVAVFVDGCFWHQCPEHGHVPRSNPDYWEKKLARNVERDRQVTDLMTEAGWTVLRIWEHVPPDDAADLIAHAVAAPAAPRGRG